MCHRSSRRRNWRDGCGRCGLPVVPGPPNLVLSGARPLLRRRRAVAHVTTNTPPMPPAWCPSEEAQHAGTNQRAGIRQPATQREGDCQVHQPSAQPLDHRHPGGIRKRNLAGEVVVHAPGQAGAQHQKSWPCLIKPCVAGPAQHHRPGYDGPPMPSAMRRSKFSLKANQASRAVKTPRH